MNSKELLSILAFYVREHPESMKKLLYLKANNSCKWRNDPGCTKCEFSPRRFGARACPVWCVCYKSDGIKSGAASILKEVIGL